ncbi:MAG: prenyltransferase/squalene oxidase repeat-containing protein [Planctomycetota bacterium]
MTEGFSQTSYLVKLSARMRKALAQGPRSVLEFHARLILSFQKDDGGFAGRRGGADLYYTGFAVRALHALGALTPRVVAGVNGYLSHQEPDNIIDELNLLSSLLALGKGGPDCRVVSHFLEGFRIPDGGYAKGTGAETGSTYHTFLAALCYDLLGERPPEPERVGAFLHVQARPDGGFCDAPTAAHSNTNATAAGLSTAMLLGLADHHRINEATAYLLSMRDATGGWLATTHAPFPDLLSTYTALMTLESAGVLTAEIMGVAAQFAGSCACEDGGFKAAPVDDQADTEYTFYGLGVSALAIEKGCPSHIFRNYESTRTE